MGTYLADTWKKLDKGYLNYVDVADMFEAVDREHTGGRFKKIIRGNFDMRDIGWVEVGPQLPKPKKKEEKANTKKAVFSIDT